MQKQCKANMADNHRAFIHSYILLLLGIIVIQNVAWEIIDGLMRAFAFHPFNPLGTTTEPFRVIMAMFFIVAGIIAITVGMYGCARHVYETLKQRFGTRS